MLPGRAPKEACLGSCYRRDFLPQTSAPTSDELPLLRKESCNRTLNCQHHSRKPTQKNRKPLQSTNLSLQNLNPTRLFHRALLAFLINIIANINRWHLSHPHYVPGSAISMYFPRLHEPRAHPPPTRSALKSAKPPFTASDSICPPRAWDTQHPPLIHSSTGKHILLRTRPQAPPPNADNKRSWDPPEPLLLHAPTPTCP